jgi:hypothetical protein
MSLAHPVEKTTSLKLDLFVSLPSPEDGSRSSFRNVFQYSEFGTMDKVLNPVILNTSSVQL